MIPISTAPPYVWEREIYVIAERLNLGDVTSRFKAAWTSALLSSLDPFSCSLRAALDGSDPIAAGWVMESRIGRCKLIDTVRASLSRGKLMFITTPSPMESIAKAAVERTA